jgi:phospholipid-binding lipoprotein MlaA
MKRSRTIAVAIVVFLLVATVGVHIDLSALTGTSIRGIALGANQNNGEPDPFAKKAKPVPDPLEKFNRAMFKLNDKLYYVLWKPVATIYAAYIPCGVRSCIRNAFDNIKMPVRFLNNLLQCKPQRAGNEVKRFVINSTLGMGGFFDVAQTHFNMKEYDEDFGQTLAVWGLNHKFFLNLPILGPSSGRDTIGRAVDIFTSPLFYMPMDFGVSAGIRGGEIVNFTSLNIGEYEDFKKSAVDPYASMRDAYIQYRADEVAR